MKRSLWMLAVTAVGLFLAPLSPAATLVVDLNGGADYTDIQSAIDAAADGDTVLVKPGEYVITEPIDFNRLHKPDDPASPAVKNIVVRSEGGAEVTTIRMAEANPASVVVFENGETQESVVHGFRMTGGTTSGIRCEDASSPTVVKCTISRNLAVHGGGVYCSGNSSPTLTSCTISGNDAWGEGGGLFCDEDSSPTLTTCTISGNSAFSGGGVCCDWSYPSLTECTIAMNLARGDGGGVGCWGGSTDLRNCTISGNTAQRLGGGVYCGFETDSWPWLETLWLSQCTISGNSASSGGGLYCGEHSAMTMTTCIVWANSGASLVVEGRSQVDISSSCLQAEALWPGVGNINADPLFCGWGERGEVWADPSNPQPGDGSQGSPFSDPRLSTTYSLALSSGSPCLEANGAAVDMGADTGRCDRPGVESRVLHMAPGTYQANDLCLAYGVSLLGAGEGTTVVEGTVVGLRTGSSIANLTVTRGTLGGIVVSAGESPAITRCTISGSSGGSGVYCGESSSPTFKDCTISCHHAVFGGGVYCSGNSSPTLTNCTITGNVSRTSEDAALGYGGGICCSDSSPTMVNCTISGNWADNGGALYCGGNSSPRLTSCIIWGNTPDSACGALSFCLTDWDPLFVKPGEWVDCGSPDDPLCVAYHWNPDTGEETAWHRWVFDYRLQPSSPAIDAGTSDGAPTTDIEGHGRPCGARVDIGAYEYGDCPASTERFRRGDADADGNVNITDGIFTLNYLFLGGSSSPCRDAADLDDGGGINITDAIYLLNFLFLGGLAPAAPFGECGIDDTLDELECAAFAPCGWGE